MNGTEQQQPALLAAYLAPHPPIIIPQIGRSDHEADHTIAALQQAARDVAVDQPETLVVLSPHAPLFSDFIFFYPGEKLAGNFSRFGHPEVSLERNGDPELANAVMKALQARGYQGGYLDDDQTRRFGLDEGLDHGVLVPLYYLGQHVPQARLVALSSGDLGLEGELALGACIAEAATQLKRRIVLIASGDLSHKVNRQSPYGSCPEGSQFDQAVVDILKSGDLPQFAMIDQRIRERAAECGYRSLLTLVGAFHHQRVQTHFYHYEAPYGIGYGVCRFGTPQDLASVPVEIARRTIASFVQTGQKPDPATWPDLDLTPWYKQQAGAFVSLHKWGQLRGCIGTIGPTTDQVVLEIIQNAISAATRDPRFDPVTADELPDLDISVDILQPAEPVTDLSQLDPQQYGVIVSRGGRRGLLLPDLDGVDSVSEQLAIACRKAGIDPAGPYEIARFRVTRYT